MDLMMDGWTSGMGDLEKEKECYDSKTTQVDY